MRLFCSLVCVLTAAAIAACGGGSSNNLFDDHDASTAGSAGSSGSSTGGSSTGGSSTGGSATGGSSTGGSSTGATGATDSGAQPDAATRDAGHGAIPDDASALDAASGGGTGDAAPDASGGAAGNPGSDAMTPTGCAVLASCCAELPAGTFRTYCETLATGGDEPTCEAVQELFCASGDGGASADAGQSCNELSTCCATLGGVQQMQCEQVVAAGLGEYCSTVLEAYQSASLCN